MALTGLTFILLLALTVLVYYLVPRRFQWVVLLAASLVFYLSFGFAQIGYVLLSTLVSYLGARALGRLNTALKQPGADKSRVRHQKRMMVIALAGVHLALLLALKYAGMLFPSAGGWIVPLGLSYFTLSAIGYVVDVYRAKYEPETNPLRLLLFEICFLHIMQGPFGRYDQMGAELRAEHSLCYENIKLGGVRMLWGLMKKMVVADWLGVYVNAAFGKPDEWSGLVMATAIVLYTLQMYFDFSGYMDVVCGAGMSLGIRVPENFNRPLGARSVAEFWRKWHITLGAWFKDYVFYPVSVSRPAVKASKFLRGRGQARLAKLIPALLAMCVVWPLTGLWHGATWNFVLWGCLNGAAIISGMLLEPVYKAWRQALRIPEGSKVWRAVSVLRTFVLLAMIRVFTPTGSVSQAMGVYRALGRWGGIGWGSVGSYVPGLRVLLMGYCMIACALACVVLIVESRGDSEALLARFDRYPVPVKYAIGVVLIYAVMLISANDLATGAGFLYAFF